MPMHPFDEFRQFQTRRQFFGRATTGVGIGAAALASLLDERGAAAAMPAEGIPGILDASAPASESPAGDLPVHARRAVADGPVR